MKMAQAEIAYESADGKTKTSASIAVPQPVSLKKTEEVERSLRNLMEPIAQALKLTSKEGIVWSVVEEHD